MVNTSLLSLHNHFHLENSKVTCSNTNRNLVVDFAMGFMSCPIPSSPSHAASSLSGYKKGMGKPGEKRCEGRNSFLSVDSNSLLSYKDNDFH